MKSILEAVARSGMLERSSKAAIFNQNKLIYPEHTSGINLHNMQIYAM